MTAVYGQPMSKILAIILSSLVSMLPHRRKAANFNVPSIMIRSEFRIDVNFVDLIKI